MATEKKYKTGLVRWTAVIPFAIFIAVIALYFVLFFDMQMKALLQWGGYQALGAEIDIASFKSSFIHGNVEIDGIQITSAQEPDFNSIELGSIRFGFSWDALLRLKFVVNEMAVENIEFMSKRKSRGKIAPPPPPKKDGPGLADQLKGQALGAVAAENKNNLLGDLSAFLKGGDYKSQLEGIESNLKSKQMAADFKTKWETKQKDWDTKLKALPNDADFKSYKTKFDQIKYKDFKSPQEVQDSIKQFNDLKKEVDSKVSTVSDTKKVFSDDLAAMKKDYETLDAQIKLDVASVKERLKIPKIDSKEIAKSIFMDYLNPYLSKLDRINELAKKYLPPKYSDMVTEKLKGKNLLAVGKTKKEIAPEENDTIQPHPRAKGITYEFPVTTGYPLFWIKEIKISSKSNAQADYGDITGVIENVVSNQRQIGKQTEMHVSGDFKSKNITGMKLNAFLNDLKDVPAASMDFEIGNYPMQAVSLVNSPDGTITMPSASLGVVATAATQGFKQYDIKLNNTFNNVQFTTNAKEKIIEDILKNAFAQLQSFDLKASASGELAHLNLDVSSSLGDKLQSALAAGVQQKIDDLNKQIKDKIDQQLGSAKDGLSKQISALTKNYVGGADQAEGKLDGEKASADDKIKTAQKDLENKAKGQLQEKGKKAIDDLKKQLGF